MQAEDYDTAKQLKASIDSLRSQAAEGAATPRGQHLAMASARHAFHALTDAASMDACFEAVAYTHAWYLPVCLPALPALTVCALKQQRVQPLQAASTWPWPLPGTLSHGLIDAAFITACFRNLQCHALCGHPT